MVGLINIVNQIIPSFQVVMLDCRSRKHIGTFMLHPIPFRMDI